MSDRLIVALDVAGAEDALALTDALADTVTFYKIGLQLFAQGDGASLARTLMERGKRIFVDLKLHDIPETVARATDAVRQLGAHFLTVHGEEEVMRAAVEAAGSKLRILAVTALTSLDNESLRRPPYREGLDINELVCYRAERAAALGCAGVVCSAHEIAAIRRRVGNDLAIVTPGIRLENTTCVDDDQRRTRSVAEAIRDGADFIVVGRPIRRAEHPAAIARMIQQQIADAEKDAR